MKTIIGIAALTATATLGFVAPATAAEPTAGGKQTASASGLDFMGNKVNYEAAADAEGMALPTKNFTISARFGQSGPYWSSGRHTGLDFAAPIGTPIMAVEDGKVVAAGPAGAYGNMIEIAHGDGTRSLYAHLSAIDVKVGQKVTRGEHIGALGNTGNSTGPHLHFEIGRKGTPVNPENFLNL